MKRHILYFLLICTVPLTLYILSLETVVPMPPDENHMRITEEKQCFECHGDGMEFARSKEHPPKDQCFKCHEVVKRR